MSHWAEINENNIVIQVTVGDNNDPNGDEGYKWLLDNLGGNWVKTSYNANFAGKYAGIGDTWNEEEGIFISVQPYASWNRVGSFWQAPVAMPEDGKRYQWDEETTSWVEITL